MKIATFELERNQSLHENRVEINLSESGIHPYTVEELLEKDPDAMRDFLAQPMPYPQTNGTPELRRSVAALYPRGEEEGVEITNGGSEANFISVFHLVQPGDGVVVMSPNYRQIDGIVRSLGATVYDWPLLPPGPDRERWEVDLKELARLCSRPEVRLLALCNPNNPTGLRLDGETLDAIADVAEECGCSILSDEVYRGAELDGVESPTMFGRTEDVIVTGGLSKAYALPGLRIGWVVTTPEVSDRLWAVHDYTTIAPGALSDYLARQALQPRTRARILDRNRRRLREHWTVVQVWIESVGAGFKCAAPDAGAIGFVSYPSDHSSVEICDRAREEESLLVVPGSHFDRDGYLRIGFGGDRGELDEGLARLRRVLDRMGILG